MSIAFRYRLNFFTPFEGFKLFWFRCSAAASTWVSHGTALCMLISCMHNTRWMVILRRIWISSYGESLDFSSLSQSWFYFESCMITFSTRFLAKQGYVFGWLRLLDEWLKRDLTASVSTPPNSMGHSLLVLFGPESHGYFTRFLFEMHQEFNSCNALWMKILQKCRRWLYDVCSVQRCRVLMSTQYRLSGYFKAHLNF